jgi:hypothetical protein
LKSLEIRPSRPPESVLASPTSARLATCTTDSSRRFSNSPFPGEKWLLSSPNLFKYVITKKLRGANCNKIDYLSQGVGGTVQFPKGYIKKAFEIVRANGGLCVSDEVKYKKKLTKFWTD